MTRLGHKWAAYLLVLLALAHWIEYRQPLDEEKPATEEHVETDAD